MQIHNLKVSQAARLMGKGEQFVRIGLQRNLLPIGTCFKQTSKSNYSYHISAKKFMEYTGITMEEIVADYQEHIGSNNLDQL